LLAAAGQPAPWATAPRPHRQDRGRRVATRRMDIAPVPPASIPPWRSRIAHPIVNRAKTATRRKDKDRPVIAKHSFPTRSFNRRA
jgi:hypothetical protein